MLLSLSHPFPLSLPPSPPHPRHSSVRRFFFSLFAFATRFPDGRRCLFCAIDPTRPGVRNAPYKQYEIFTPPARPRRTGAGRRLIGIFRSTCFKNPLQPSPPAPFVARTTTIVFAFIIVTRAIQKRRWHARPPDAGSSSTRSACVRPLSWGDRGRTRS